MSKSFYSFLDSFKFKGTKTYFKGGAFKGSGRLPKESFFLPINISFLNSSKDPC